MNCEWSKRANCILGCFKRSTENGPKEVVVLLNQSAAVASVGVFCTVLGSTRWIEYKNIIRWSQVGSNGESSGGHGLVWVGEGAGFVQFGGMERWPSCWQFPHDGDRGGPTADLYSQVEWLKFASWSLDYILDNFFLLRGWSNTGTNSPGGWLQPQAWQRSRSNCEMPLGKCFNP